MQEWKEIPGHEEYMVSIHGHIRRSSKKKNLSPFINGNGYLTVCLCRNGKHVKKKVSYLVLLTFVSDRPEGMEICHNDGNRLNDALINLRWATRKENHADKKNHGTHLHGEKVGTSKLRIDEVIDIKFGSLSGVEAAKKYKVSTTNVSKIRRGLIWAHLQMDGTSDLSMCRDTW